MSRIFRYFFYFTIFLGVFVSSFYYNLSYVGATALENAQADKARLEAELSSLEKEIAAKQKELDKQKGKSVSLSRDIAILTTQIKKSKLDIQSKNLTIQKLGGEINQKSKKISSLNLKIEAEKESLAQLIRKEREIDNKNIMHLLLSNSSISDAYGDIDTFASIKESIKESVDEIRGVKTETEEERKSLENKRNSEADAKFKLEEAKKKVEISEAEKQKLLSISKNKEAEYQKVLAEKARRKSEILAAMFNLVGSSQQINFETALSYAKEAQKKTGIDPVFLLAVITQESNLGKNVGQCYVTDLKNGNGKGANTGSNQIRVMSPIRDIPVFVSITNKLGLDYSSTRVSCWIPMYKKKYDKKIKKWVNDYTQPYGWGGAMGPAQFIPSTWKLFENRLRALLGYDASPWRPKDAFMASAMYLTDLGARETPSSQQIAACKYYGTGGSVCDYSKNVMNHKLKIQTTMIDPLQD
jgi:hypothetical protein